jgi:hypothetical protein
MRRKDISSSSQSVPLLCIKKERKPKHHWWSPKLGVTGSKQSLMDLRVNIVRKLITFAAPLNHLLYPRMSLEVWELTYAK